MLQYFGSSSVEVPIELTAGQILSVIQLFSPHLLLTEHALSSKTHRGPSVKSRHCVFGENVYKETRMKFGLCDSVLLLLYSLRQKPTETWVRHHRVENTGAAHRSKRTSLEAN